MYIRKSKKGCFYTCIFIENGLRKALRTYIFRKMLVFVCTFSADRGKIGRNAHINSTKKPFSYVRPPQTGMPQRSQQRLPATAPRRSTPPPQRPPPTIPPCPAQRSNGHPGAYPRHSPCKKGRPCEAGDPFCCYENPIYDDCKIIWRGTCLSWRSGCSRRSTCLCLVFWS